MKLTLNLILTLFFSFFLTNCQNEDEGFTPKPRGYHRLSLPKAEYVSLPDTFPYTFRYSAHAKLLNDTSNLAERYWAEVYYPQFTANLDISYKRIGNKQQFMELVNDSHNLAGRHTIKAYSIQETILKTEKGLNAAIFELEGEIPTQLQFYVTDSTDHFLRIDLYFPTSLQNDSLAPVIDFVKKDMMVMLHSIEWNSKVVPPRGTKTKWENIRDKMKKIGK